MCAAALITMDQPILLILTGEDCRNAIKAAFDHAKLTSKRLHVVQILTSDLYHYGHQDLVATRPSKKQFLLHIRDEVLKRGKAEVQALEETAQEMGITLEIHSIESEDILSAALSAVKKGYDIVFLPKQQKKLFPLFKRTLAEYLRKKVSGRIVPC
jgi:hypothetical protein